MRSSFTATSYTDKKARVNALLPPSSVCLYLYDKIIVIRLYLKSRIILL